MKRLSILVLVLLLVAAVAAIAAPESIKEAKSTYKIIGQTADTPISQGAGKPLLIVFWASWCGPCMIEIPHINDLQEKYAPQGLKIVAVNMDMQPEESVRRIVARLRIQYPVAMPSPELLREYKVSAIPTSYLYGADGKLARTWVGPPAPLDLENAVRDTLGMKLLTAQQATQGKYE